MPEPTSWRDIACPTCGAPARQRCFQRDGRPATEPHAARRQGAAAAGVPTPVLAYPENSASPHIVSADDPTRALCGAVVGTPPVLQPPLRLVHAKCLNLLGKKESAPAIPPTGVCPECVNEEDLDDLGRIKPHFQMLGGVRTSLSCPGGGREPEVDA